jgi:Flp pilus assembly protein TadG
MRISHNRSRSKGATLIEFALVAPLFFFLVFATIEFGRYFFVQHAIQYATREGTRFALVGKTLKDQSGNDMTRADSIIATIKTTAATAVKSGLQINIYPVGSGYTDPTGWETKIDAGQGGDYMRVRVQYQYRFFTPFIKNFFPQGVTTIKASALYRNELF